MFDQSGSFERFLDLDYLRASGSRPHFFGLGFIQLKLDKNTRMHFWHPELSSTVHEEELHDHRYDFESKILYGSMKHIEFEFRKDGRGDHDMIEKSCKPGSEIKPRSVARGFVEMVGSYSMAAGTSYKFPKHKFHRIEATECITYLTRGPVEKDLARIIKPVLNPVNCPFSDPKQEDMLWDLIADLINKATGRVGNPGYHLRPIEKGIFGESNKIVEEIEEFKEALEQRSHIMALIELSDAIGAIEGYLAKHHPTLSLDDLKTFSDITQRAFRNGHRD